MRSVQLIHNPRAGDESYDKKRILELLEKNGYKCGYLSTKVKGWKLFESGAELLIIAGGDGTVRKVMKQLLKRKRVEQPRSIGILPTGTANNIAKTLQISRDLQQAIDDWKSGSVKKIDVGLVRYSDKQEFFLESFGCGLFPLLMEQMKEGSEEPGSAKDELKRSLKLLHDLALNYKGKECTLTIDRKRFSGGFLLAEVLNTPFMGPNLQLSPRSEPGDGLLEVVLVEEKHREAFADYIDSSRRGKRKEWPFPILRGKTVELRGNDADAHCDDKAIRLEKDDRVSIRLQRERFRFLVPGQGQDPPDKKRSLR